MKLECYDVCESNAQNSGASAVMMQQRVFGACSGAHAPNCKKKNYGFKVTSSASVEPWQALTERNTDQQESLTLGFSVIWKVLITTTRVTNNVCSDCV